MQVPVSLKDVVTNQSVNSLVLQRNKTLVNHISNSNLTSFLEPKVHLHEEEQKVVITIPSNQIQTLRETSSLGYSLTSKVEFSMEQARKICHEITYGCFTESTDVPLGDFFPNSEYKNLTPDYIIQDSGWTHVVEFSTCAFPSFEIMSARAKDKYDKYLDPIILSCPANESASLDVIVTSSKSVVSTLNLPPLMVDELVMRYQLSLRIQNTLELLGIRQSHWDDLEDYTTKITEVLAKIKVEDIKEVYEYKFENYMKWLSGFNKNVVSSIISKSQVEAIDLMKRDCKEYTKEEIIYDIKSGLEERYPEIDVRYDNKAVIQFPYWSVEPKSELSNSLNFQWSLSFKGEQDTLPDNLEHLRKMWKIANEQTNRLDFGDANYERLIEIANKELYITEETSKKMRKTYRRVEIKMEHNEKVELAKIGVEGKRLKSNYLVDSYRKDKKKTFSLRSNTSDIDAFIFDNELCLSRSSGLSRDMILVNRMVELALSLYDCSSDQMVEKNMPLSELRQTFLNFLNTNAFNVYCMMSTVGIELMASLRQNVHKDNYVIKVLRNYDLYMIIKPTNSTSHIFVSFGVPADKLINLDTNNTKTYGWKKWYRIGDFIITDFVSYTADKLENLVKMGPMAIAMFAQWSKHVSLPVEEELDGSQLPSEFWHNHNLSMMMMANNKRSAEELMTQFRYISMEGFVSFPFTRNSRKCIRKFPERLRSRLDVWLIKKLSTAMIKIDVEGYSFSKDGPCWLNMFNPYTNDSITDSSNLLNIYYVGYIKDKKQVHYTNATFKLVEKIIVEEFKAKKDEKIWNNLGEENDKDDDFKPHEYSTHFVKYMAETFNAQMRRKLGPDFKALITRQIDKALYSVTYEDMATLKASSTFTAEKENIGVEEVKYTRQKVIETITTLIGREATRPVFDLPLILDKLEQDGCLRVDIFEKLQHGSTREIYVLDIPARMIQKFVELIFRVLCTYIDGETMTHPSNKITLMTQHGFNVARYQSTKEYEENKFVSINMNAAEDKQRWNQTNTPSKFLGLILNIVDLKYHGFLMRSLSLWSTKKIFIPADLLNFMKDNPNVEVYNPLLKDVMSDFSGKTQNATLGIIQKNKTYMTIRTGMMQGILHFASSFFHSCFNIVVEQISYMTFKTLMPNSRLTFTCMQSSDDTSYMLTMHCPESDVSKARNGMALIIEMVDSLGMRVGIKRSKEKTTLGLTQMIEFNSEWVSINQLNKPDIKWIIACMNVDEAESLSERQEHMSNSLTQCVEAGTPAFAAHIIQWGQAYLYYLILGSSVNPLFEQFSFHLSRTYDPGLGFMLMDPCYCPGFAGFSMNFYNAVSKTDLNKRVKSLLNTGSLTSTHAGTLVRGAVVYFGNRARWEALFNKVSAWAEIPALQDQNPLKPSWLEHIDRNPKTLYLTSKTRMDIALKLMVKLTSPSVVSSLSKINTLSRIVSSSIYVIDRPVVSVGQAWLEAINHSGGREKFSLWWLACHEPTGNETLSTEDLMTIFPYYLDYNAIINTQDLIGQGTMSVWDNMNKKRARVVVAESLGVDRISLDGVCTYKWFEINKTYCSKATLERSWNSFKSFIPWLDECPHKTLKNSGYLNHVQLHNFISQNRMKTRVIRLTSAPYKTNEGESSLLSALRRNSWVNRLINIEGLPGTQVERDDMLLAHLAASISSFPLSNEAKLEKFKETLLLPDNIKIPNINACSYRNQKLAIFSKFILNDTMEGQELAIDEIIKYKQGTVGGWLDRQRYVEKNYEGWGMWVGTINGVNLRIRVNNKGEITTVEIEKADSIKEILEELRNLAFECRLIAPIRSNNVGCLYSIENWSLTRSMNRGIGVKEVDKHKLYSYEFDREIFAEINGRNFRLYTIVDGSQMSPGRSEQCKITILSYRARDVDMRKTLGVHIKDNFLLNAWVNFMSFGSIGYRNKEIQRERVKCYVKSNSNEVGRFTEEFIRHEDYLRRMGQRMTAQRARLDDMFLDTYLASLGLLNMQVAKDGNCQYGAVKAALSLRPNIQSIRNAAAHNIERTYRNNPNEAFDTVMELDYGRGDRDLNLDSYLEGVRTNAWGDHFTLVALCNVYGFKCRVFTYTGIVDVGNRNETIFLKQTQSHYSWLKISKEKRKEVIIPGKRVVEFYLPKHETYSFPAILKVAKSIAEHSLGSSTYNMPQLHSWMKNNLLQSLERLGICDLGLTFKEVVKKDSADPEVFFDDFNLWDDYPNQLRKFEGMVETIGEDDIIDILRDALDFKQLTSREKYDQLIDVTMFEIENDETSYDEPIIHPLFDNYVKYLEHIGMLTYLDGLFKNEIREGAIMKFPTEVETMCILFGISQFKIMKNKKVLLTLEEGVDTEDKAL